MVRARLESEKVVLLWQLLQDWLRYPELRLGQLVCVATGSKDIFYMEDGPLIRSLERLGKPLNNPAKPAADAPKDA